MSERLREIVRFGLGVLPAVAVFAVLEPVVRALVRLPTEAYTDPVILVGLGRRLLELLTERPVIGATFVLALVIVAALPRTRAYTRAWLSEWTVLEDGQALRILMGFVAGLLAWVCSLYAFNTYLGQLHLFDRAAVVGLCALAFWRPAFLLPFAFVAWAVAGQFDVPFAMHSWTETDLLFRIPILFIAWWTVRAVSGERDIRAFVFLLIALLAVTYWASGWGKLEIGWILNPHLHWLFVGAHGGGWLGGLDVGTVERMASVISALAIPLMILTLGGELGAIFMLWRRWTLLGLLGLWMLFHAGAFLTTGIFFWKWMAVEGALVVFLLRGRRLERLRLAARAPFWVFVALIAGHPIWINAVNLTWYDTPLNYSLRFEGVDASGRSYLLPYTTFRPYEDSFVIGSFDGVARYGRLTGAMGVTQDDELAAALAAATDTADVWSLERARATPRFSSEFASDMDRFVSAYLRDLNGRNGRHRMLPSPLRPPRHLWTSPRETPWTGDEPIVRVRLFEDTRFYDGDRLHLLRTRLLRTVDVESGRGIEPS